MVSVRDLFPTPGGGPRPRSGLPVPHPASGRAPDLMEILAESMAYSVPDARYEHPNDIAAIAGMVNNPQSADFGPDAMIGPIMNLIMAQGMTGQMPALGRSTLESISDMLISQLDTEAGVNPTIARMLLRGNREPTVEELMMSGDPGLPSLASRFEGMSPIDNPELLRGRVTEMRNLLANYQPDIAAGERAALETIAGEAGDLSPELSQAFEGRTPSTGKNLDELLQLLDAIGGMGQLTEPSALPGYMQQVFTALEGRVPAQRLYEALHGAVQRANIGSETQYPGMNPESRRSLAPDIDPGAIRGNLGSEADMLMNLLGLTGTYPRSNV